MASGERLCMIFSKSSIAICCVSRSASLLREIRILCLSSITAKCDVGPPDLPVLGGLAFASFTWFVAILQIKIEVRWVRAFFMKFAEICMGLKQISVFL